MTECTCVRCGYPLRRGLKLCRVCEAAAKAELRNAARREARAERVNGVAVATFKAPPTIEDGEIPF